MFKNILLATDGSAASEHAAKVAVDLARTHEAGLTALYVIDPYPYLNVGESNPMGFQAYMSSAAQHAAEAHAKVARLCTSGERIVELQMRRAEDISATEGILQAARELHCDLIVVGSHGRTGIARLMLGSVAGQVVAQSPVPVLVAR
ncbi:MAG TPA: universal stress protein [Ramlibacter sp.]|nr:universal stress protein [Ramlibacter sp.]